MKKMGGKFLEYAIVEISGKRKVLLGTLTRDPRFSEKDVVRTSIIESINNTEAETMNTLYELGSLVTDETQIKHWKAWHYPFFECHSK